MTPNQIKMLQKAQLDWLERELSELGAAAWVIEALCSDNIDGMKIVGAIGWLEANGYGMDYEGNHVILFHDGKEVSRFVWTVE